MHSTKMEKRKRKTPSFFKEFVFPGRSHIFQKNRKDEENCSKNVSDSGLKKKDSNELTNYDLAENQIHNFFDLSEFDHKVEELIRIKELEEKILNKNKI